MTENSRLKSEIDLLSDIRVQNDGLRNQIHAIASSADGKRLEMEIKLESLMNQIRYMKNSTDEDVISPDVAQSKKCLDL